MGAKHHKRRVYTIPNDGSPWSDDEKERVLILMLQVDQGTHWNARASKLERSLGRTNRKPGAKAKGTNSIVHKMWEIAKAIDPYEPVLGRVRADRTGKLMTWGEIHMVRCMAVNDSETAVRGRKFKPTPEYAAKVLNRDVKDIEGLWKRLTYKPNFGLA